ncbi:hypothetical protein chiPu_0032671, partial [Chiloscyllium punctatum]|nr:hypothetical protein [Chiloscyllium punctatum]
VEQSGGGKQGQHAEDIGLCLGTADGHEPDRHRDDADRDQHHQEDAAAPPGWPVSHERLGHGRIVAIGGHLERHGSSASRRRPAGHLAPECLNRTRKRKSTGRQFRKLRAFQAVFRPLLPQAGQAAPQPHHVTDDFGNRVIVLDRDFLVDVDGGIERPGQRHVLHDRDVVLLG